jgi:hypothetical protein
MEEEMTIIEAVKNCRPIRRKGWDSYLYPTEYSFSEGKQAYLFKDSSGGPIDPKLSRDDLLAEDWEEKAVGQKTMIYPALVKKKSDGSFLVSSGYFKTIEEAKDRLPLSHVIKLLEDRGVEVELE